jgi:aminotransferase
MSLVPSRRSRTIRPSPIRTMSVECARVGGINLAQGVCDTPVPEVVRRAAREAIDAGANTYTRAEGADELREALAKKLRRHSGLDYEPAEILVTNGATGAFYAAALALLEPGDEVLLFEPYYGYHRNTLAALDLPARLVRVSPPDWRLDAAALERAIGPRTRALVINTPANPFGKVFARDELLALAEIAQRRDLIVFTDEVYEHFVFDGREHLSPAALPGMRERTIAISALSKTFAITGWRIGWLAAPRPLIDAFAAVSDLVYVCAPTPLQLGCARALEELGDDYYRGIAREYQAKRDRFCGALAAAGLPPYVPQGSYFALADVSRLPGRTGLERAMHLLHATGLASVPGEAFYDGPEAAVTARFCFGKTEADLAEACRRLEAFGR